MSIETAVFAVQRGDQQFSCKGSELNNKLVGGDTLAVQRGDTLHQFTVYADYMQHGGWFHVIPTTGALPIKLGPLEYYGNPVDGVTQDDIAARTVYDIDGNFIGDYHSAKTLEMVYPNEYIITTNANASHLLRDNLGLFKFGPRTNTRYITSMQDLVSHNWRASDFDLKYLDTRWVQNFEWMFWNSPQVNDPAIANFDTSSATVIDGMIGHDQNHSDYQGVYYDDFSLDLSHWCVPLIFGEQNNFGRKYKRNNTSPLIDSFENNPEKLPQWGTCPGGNP